MNWVGPSFSAQHKADVFLTSCFGQPDKEFFLYDPTFPFPCAAIKKGTKNMFVAQNKKLKIQGHGQIPTPLTNTLSGIAEQMYELVLFTEALEVQAAISDEGSVMLLAIRGNEHPDYVPLTWGQMEKYGEKFRFRTIRRYMDKSWTSYWQTWNYSHYDAILQWDDTGYPTLLPLDAVAVLAVAEAQSADLLEVCKLHERLRWCFTYACLNNVPCVEALDKPILTKLEKHIFDMITNYKEDVPHA